MPRAAAELEAGREPARIVRLDWVSIDGKLTGFARKTVNLAPGFHVA